MLLHVTRLMPRTATPQWSGKELAEKLNLSPQAQQGNFHVNPLALKQRLVLSRRYLHKWGVLTILLHQEEKATVEYFNLREMLRNVEERLNLPHTRKWVLKGAMMTH